MNDSQELPIIVWIRHDLRLSNNPALSAAALTRRPVLCIFVLEDHPGAPRPLGGAARWWLHGSLEALGDALAGRGGALKLFRGSALDVILGIVERIGAAGVYWNRRYGSREQSIDAALKTMLKERNVEAVSFPGNLLYEPWTVESPSGKSFQVYSSFCRAALRKSAPEPPLPEPRQVRFASAPIETLSVADLSLRPTAPDWTVGLRETWQTGESAAKARLNAFLANRLRGYARMRDNPPAESTSQLSPYLRFGEISPRQVWRAVAVRAVDASRATEADVDKFYAELGWREFSYYLLHHHPDLAERNFRPEFDAMLWRTDAKALKAWQKGRTGYPLVDAGMRRAGNGSRAAEQMPHRTSAFLIPCGKARYSTRKDGISGVGFRNYGRCRARRFTTYGGRSRQTILHRLLTTAPRAKGRLPTLPQSRSRAGAYWNATEWDDCLPIPECSPDRHVSDILREIYF
jgi:deoxyribodipyrimidine photo-lyase